MEIDLKTLGNPYKFEEICKLLLDEEFPNIKPVDGAGGDLGIDTFAGELSKELIIFQFKYFCAKLGTAQKNKIRSSLEKASISRPKRWILILPIDLNIAAHKWLESLKKEYPGIEIEVWGETRLKKLLYKYPHIRDNYFSLTDYRIRRLEKMQIVSGTIPVLPAKKLHDDCKENIKLINIDHPGYIIGHSFLEDKISLTAYPRDPIVLEVDPPIVSKFVFPNTPAGKKDKKSLKNMYRTGSEAKISGIHIKEFRTIFDNLFPQDLKIETMEIKPIPPEAITPVKISAQSGDCKTSTLDYIELKTQQIGAEELVVSNEDQNFSIILTFHVNKLRNIGQLTITLRHSGLSPSIVLEGLKFCNTIQHGALISVINLNTKNQLLKADFAGGSFGNDELNNWVSLMDALIILEKKLNKKLFLPVEITQSNQELISHLVQLLEYGKAQVYADNINFSISKGNLGEIPKYVEAGIFPDLIIGPIEYEVSLFGVKLQIGSLFVHCGDSQIIGNRKQIIDKIGSLSCDETLNLKIKPNRDTVIYECGCDVTSSKIQKA